MEPEYSQKFRKTMCLIEAGHSALTIYSLSFLDGKEKESATAAAYEKMAQLGNIQGFADIYLKPKEGRIAPGLNAIDLLVKMITTAEPENAQMHSPAAIRSLYDVLLPFGFAKIVIGLSLFFRQLTESELYDPTDNQLFTIQALAEQRNDKALIELLQEKFRM